MPASDIPINSYEVPVSRVQVLPHVSPLDVEYVLPRLRPVDVDEAAAFGLDPALGPRAVLHYAKDTFVTTVGGVPAFIFGTVEPIPGVRQLYGFGTPATWRTIPAITRFARGEWIPQLVAAGMRRLQVQVPERAEHSIRWLTKCGLRPECKMLSAATDGSAIIQLAASQKELQDHVFRITAAAARRDVGAIGCTYSENVGRCSVSK